MSPKLLRKLFHNPRTAWRSAVMSAVLAAWAALPLAADPNEPLPELGDSAERLLSPTQEKRIGDQFRRQLFSDPTYIGDLEVNTYMGRLGSQIARNASLRGMPISVHLVRNPVLNAFAVPGGHITFHTGLILAADDENELAAVMAHEIAHVSQRHLPRMVAKMEAGRLPAAAAILASIVVGGQTGLAGLTVANAALLSHQLSFTRSFEREADAIGIKLLTDSGFDPTAMARFFGKLQGPSGLSDEGPEYLRTHPLSYTRIAEAENRSSTHSPGDYPGSRAFFLIRAKIRALYTASNPREAIKHFTDQVANTSGDQKDAAVYGLALALWKHRQFDQARATLKPLLDSHPGEVAFQLAQAEIDRTSGRPAPAAARYERLVAAQPQLAYLTHYQAEALIDNGEAADAKRIVRRQLRRHKEMYTLYRLLAKSNAKLGMMPESHQAEAEYYAALGEYPEAISALKLALQASDSKEGYLYNSVSARLSELEKIVHKQLLQQQ
ncbi:MAG: M48 family metalloprotease [Gammaproteobacteria bacterium]|nr:M48 family metalloprotease [Gammaproteobacteria bacterium]